MPGKGGKGYVKDFKDMRDRITPYLGDLTTWLEERRLEIDKLLAASGKQTRGGDPPPQPPDLGP